MKELPTERKKTKKKTCPGQI